ncbi:amidase family protein [Streptosporangium sp. NPDC050855]|uniref:amidase family protein n=1 Tax=Streptosporangium sp. NPDC050855 TaxID=3366194 RepID=UPI0037BABD92
MTLDSIDGIGLGERLATGDIHASEVVEGALRLTRTPQAEGTFITMTIERAIGQATAADARYATGHARSSLDGVPVAVKDLFDLIGTVTTAGSRTRSALPPAEHDACVVGRLFDAGMVCIGKTNLSEFALGGLGVNPHFGTPLNPTGRDDARLAPGGSSSGSAVAVALGIVPIAVGTDTSGSVRVPAALCGVIGYKTSRGRYGDDGMLPLSPTLDSIGIFATSMRDIIATDAVLATAPPAPSAPEDGRPVRLVIPRGELLDDCAPPVRRRFQECTAFLAKQGVQVEERRLPALTRAQEVMDRHTSIVEAEAHARYRHLLHSNQGARVDPAVIRRLARFAAQPRDPGPVHQAMKRLRVDIGHELGDALLACPTVRHTAPPLAPLLADERLYDLVNRQTLRTTMLLSHLGMPGVTLPIGTPRTGPVGLLLSAPSGGDLPLLAGASRVSPMTTGPTAYAS